MIRSTYTPSMAALAALAAGDPSALLAATRARFGGFVMVDPPADPPADPPVDPPVVTDPPAPPVDPPADPEPNADLVQARADLAAAQATAAAATATLDRLRAAITGDDDGSNPPDADALAAQVESSQTEVAELRAELAVHRVAAAAGGNANALLDSRAFSATLRGLDATSATYDADVTAAIRAAVKANRTLAATTTSSGGAPGAGTGAADPASGAVTAEAFAAMSYAERSELYRTNPDLYTRLAG